jgi:hypothetical protein
MSPPASADNDPAASQPPGDGFYAGQFTLDEIAGLISSAINGGLDEEVRVTRVTVRRILEKLGLGQALTEEDYARFAALVLNGAGTIARLLRSQRALSDKAAEGIVGAVGQVLDELSTEWETPL